MQTMHDWALFASLGTACTWTVEWLCLCEEPRPVARFRPADVVATRLRDAEPKEFWRPGGTQRRSRSSGAIVQIADDAWELAAEGEEVAEEAAEEDAGPRG